MLRWRSETAMQASASRRKALPPWAGGLLDAAWEVIICECRSLGHFSQKRILYLHFSLACFNITLDVNVNTTPCSCRKRQLE